MTAGFLLATRSPDKLREIRELLPEGIVLRSLDEAGIAADPAEDGLEVFHSFRENAIAKARYFADLARTPVLADDSGICVSALDGAPGVRSKRFSDGVRNTGTPIDDGNNELLLERMRPFGAGERRAWYVCAAAAAWPDGRTAVAMGAVGGSIARAPAGEHGFGYDPLFVPDGSDHTFAQIDAATKHAQSHRGRAFRALAVLLALGSFD